jgi:taurine--2-oxoglutarate transaminase
MTTQELQKLDRDHVIYSWKAQGGWKPVMIERAEGVYMYDTDGRRILDGCAGLLNINIGHSNRHVLDAMKAQMEKLCFVSPGFGTEPKARLAAMVAELTPGDLDYVFFTNGGAEANENAIKAARWFTGRHKIYAAWKSYHGATGGAITLTGDPRRWPAEPGIPGVEHFFGPYPYRCPFGSRDAEECGRKSLAVLKEQLMYDNPASVAAVIMEPIVGTNGIVIPPKSYMQGVRQLCDENGILLIIDEVMSGWGRAGRWFATEHFDIVPDIMTTAKGITSGYVQLGATIWSRKIWEHFQERKFTSGLTYCGHPLACACGVANIEVYKEQKLILASAENGAYLEQKLMELAGRHPSVGDTRCKGLWACIELVSDRKTKAPIAGYNDAFGNVSGPLGKIFMDNGLYLYCNWDYIFISPPLIITRPQIDEMLAVVEKGLAYTDTLVKRGAPQ